jgi:hypothetical protein
MTDDKDRPRIGIVTDTGAGGMRALAQLAGEDGPLEAAVTDKVERKPDVQGTAGRAWLCDIEALYRAARKDRSEYSLIDQWVVEAPWAHPVWHSYLLVLIHLRPIPGMPPPKMYLQDATHEMWLYALDPDKSRREIIESANMSGSLLQPMNFGAQFIELSDELASERIRRTVQDICDRKLSPDTDYRRDWQKLFGSWMVKEEFR